MHYFVLELYPPLLEPIFPESAKLAKATVLSELFEHDIQVQVRVQEVLDDLVPPDLRSEVYNEFNPMFFPEQEEQDESNDEEQMLLMEEDFSDFNPFKMSFPDKVEPVFQSDVLQSTHYLINEPFEHLELYCKVFITAEAVNRINFDINVTEH